MIISQKLVWCDEYSDFMLAVRTIDRYVAWPITSLKKLDRSALDIDHHDERSSCNFLTASHTTDLDSCACIVTKLMTHEHLLQKTSLQAWTPIKSVIFVHKIGQSIKWSLNLVFIDMIWQFTVSLIWKINRYRAKGNNDCGLCRVYIAGTGVPNVSSRTTTTYC